MPLLVLKIHLTKINKKTLRWLTLRQSQWNWGTSLKPIDVLVTTGEITKNGTLATNFYKTAGEANPYISVWPTGNFLTHPRTSFSINEWWSNKYDKHNSTTNNRRLEIVTRGIHYINQSNKLKQKSMKTQPAPSPRPSTNLRGKQIRISGLCTTHRQFEITPEDKFQDQSTLILSMLTNR